MFYGEAVDFSTTYREDSQTFPTRFDRYRNSVVLKVLFLVIRPQGLFGVKIVERV